MEKISEKINKKKTKHFFHRKDYCLHLYCYFHNVSADISSGLPQVLVELGNPYCTSN